ncbi:MAG: hypothetical protein SF029_10735 [bacterium]|nr:hypothetical protein [bacterium]
MSAFITRSVQPHELDWLDRAGIPVDALLKKPGFTLKQWRLGTLNHQPIEVIQVEPGMLTCGRALLRVGLLRGLYIDPGYRGEGYLYPLLQDALAILAEQRVHLALMYVEPSREAEDIGGILCDDFGFSPAWPLTLLEFDAEEAARLPIKTLLRPAKAADAPRLAALYHQQWESRTSLARSPQSWTWRLPRQLPPRAQIAVAETRKGTLEGYCALSQIASSHVELVTDTPEAACSLVGEAARTAVNAGLTRLAWWMPPDDAAIAYLRTMLDCTLSAHYGRRWGWMARVIDSGGLIDALLPEATANLRVLRPDVIAPPLMEAQPEQVRVRLRGQEDTVAVLPYRDFIQWILGGGAPILSYNRSLTDHHAALLRAMFPPRVAAVGAWEMF